jgi:hypothetical protein
MGDHFVKFRGLTVRNVYQPTKVIRYWNIIVLGLNTTYENMIVHDIGVVGLSIWVLLICTNTYDTTRWIKLRLI